MPFVRPQPRPMPARLRNRHLLVLDALLVLASSLIAYVVRFEGWNWAARHDQTFVVYCLVATPMRLAIYYWAGLYRGLWRHASISELERIFVGGLAAGIAS